MSSDKAESQVSETESTMLPHRLSIADAESLLALLKVDNKCNSKGRWNNVPTGDYWIHYPQRIKCGNFGKLICE